MEGINKAVKEHFEEGRYKEERFKRPTLDGVRFKQISQEENNMLTTPFSLEEIKEVVWECDDNKSPGLDGLNFTFIKSCWEIISPEILKFFKEFYRLGRLPKAVCASFMAFIPKNSSPQGLHEYRPISLIGCLYKMLAKVLAGRLKNVLGNVIS